jgi:hypothetical protein
MRGHWWRYSQGVKDVVTEGIAYLYGRFFFYPSRVAICAYSKASGYDSTPKNSQRRSITWVKFLDFLRFALNGCS